VTDTGADDAGPGGSPVPVVLRAAGPGDRDAVRAFLAEHHSSRVARLGELVVPLDHDQVLAVSDGRLVGVATYAVREDGCELVTLHAVPRRLGVGTALVEQVRMQAAARSCARLWLVTTNDNVDALRFYQRRGFRLTALHPGAVDDSRRELKPEIPRVGSYGIPLRDEIVLEASPG
jgi:GNAT superfamily N-acetyltransferase